MVHKALKLQHHRHTAKRLKHEHTSYRGLFVVFALTALCAGTIQSAAADDYGVSATVPSGSLTQPAVVGNPPSGTMVTSNPVTVTGTCQVVAGGTIVVLEREGVDIGSQACQPDGTFGITITLLTGNNLILPKVYTSGFTPGPDGQAINLIWSPLVADGTQQSGTASGASGTIKQTGSAPGPLEIQIDRSYLVYLSDKPARLPLTISGGSAPYTLAINWGDGSAVEEWNVKNAGASSYEHAYRVNSSYSITVTVVDARGEKYSMQIAAMSMLTPALTVAYPNQPFAAISAFFASPVTRVVWGIYGMIALLTIGFWAMSPTHSLLWRGPGPGHWLLRRRP